MPFKAFSRWREEHFKLPECRGVIRYASAVDILLIGNGVGHKKMTEYCSESEIFMVYHLEMHTCPPKQNTKQYKSLVREAVLRNNGLVACAVQQADVGEAVAAGDI